MNRDYLHSAQQLGQVIESAFQYFSKNPALWVNGQVYTYEELGQFAGDIATRLEESTPPKSRIAVFSHRNPIAYSGLLGTLLSGRTYVPINPRFPIDRNLDILKMADVRAVICDPACAEVLSTMRTSLPSDLVVLTPDLAQTPQHAGPWTLPPKARVAKGGSPRTHPVTRNDIAYLLFTSGTTGHPKGVPVSHGNLLSYLANITQLLNPQSTDRSAQLAELTFDMSIHEMFIAWSTGGSLYTVPEGFAPFLDRFVQECEITLLTLVPSAAALLKSQGRLTDGSLPSLRHSLFGGEALPTSLASAWQKAAPHSVVRNLYGPTEATCCFTGFKWMPELENELPAMCPIGDTFPGQSILLVDSDLNPVAPGQEGELLVHGSQVTEGYLNNPEATRRAYVRLAGQKGVWYRTGDRVRDDARFGLIYTGRVDQQLKVRGFRVEGQDVESHVRVISGGDQVAVVGWPLNVEGMAMGTVAFVVSPKHTEDEIIAACKKRMPDYMAPTRIIPMPQLPLTTNGKVDYVALAQSSALKPQPDPAQ
jgi:D-alanine--poly(phosphoribitol) ligase subunit 1